MIGDTPRDEDAFLLQGESCYEGNNYESNAPAKSLYQEEKVGLVR
jgi:hypothetical protein